MGQLRASIATAVATNPDPDDAIAAVDLFAVQGADTLGASVAYVLFDRSAPAKYISAGHVPMVRFQSATGRATLLERGRRPLLGFRLADEVDRSEKLDFGAGDLLVMFSDGLIERRGETIDEGLHRLMKAVEELADRSPQEIGDALLERLTEGYDPDDDIALLVIRRR
jgi:serine phosphatase RsbU (regulator of sigma subunit)